MKKLSVIVPVYNGENYLAETIKGILASDYPELELVLVNDGSKDNSARICEEYCRKDSRVHYYSKENGGIVSARNYGMSVATGEYLCFCDQDDLMHQQMYQVMMDEIERNDCEMAICSTGKLVQGEVVPFESFPDQVLQGKEIRQELLMPILCYGFDFSNQGQKRENHYAHIWKCIISKKLIQDNGLQFRRFIDFEDDLLIMTDLLCAAQKICTLSRMFYYWRVNKASESYRPKYISDLEAKQDAFVSYLKAALARTDVGEQEIRQCEAVWLDRNCLQMLDNLSSPLCPLKWKEKQRYFRTYLHKPLQWKALEIRGCLNKGQYRLKVILGLLAADRITGAYLFNQNYMKVSHLLSSQKYLVRLERKTKSA